MFGLIPCVNTTIDAECAVAEEVGWVISFCWKGRMRVLVVDDDVRTAAVIYKIIRQVGVVVDEGGGDRDATH